ncbi:MAG: Uncharacterized protein XD60_1294 [Acetothermia bacterium 64_32]|nr:MAG: Uncharacterized protein XD60_1294 [Acetothermia bacterium 64_32]HAF71086.1 hypothetical protein [Candidatus Acetothermia bacterium]
MESRKRRVMAGSIDPCVHTLGTEKFAEWMESLGLKYVAIKLGPAVTIDELLNKVEEARPEVVAISYRLGDLHVDEIIAELVEKAHQRGLDPKTSGIRWAFGATRPAANLVRAMTGKPIEPDKFSPPEDRHFDLEAVAREYAGKEKFQGFFELIVDDYVTMEELEQFARRIPGAKTEALSWSDELLERIAQVREREKRPIIRAHIGIAGESLEPTIEGVKKLAEAEALEIVSLAPDQPSQAFLAKYVRGEEDPNAHPKGQGGAPITCKEDLIALKEATKRGNFPLSRIYSGTDELLELAKLFQETLNMAFPAVPIFFYSQLDGRGPLSIRDGIEEHFKVMRWWASIGKPLEINDPHQWQLRDCSDDMYVTDHVLAGIVALKMGIKHYIMQLMFDLPPEIYPLYDLAKMRAAYELIEPLTRHFDFHIIRETRGGLSSFPPNLDRAKGHLAMTTYWQMFMEPDIVHVVSISEAHHEAKAEDIIESCDIAKMVFEEFRRGPQPDIWSDPRVIARKEELKRGAMYNIFHLALLGGYRGKVTLDNFFEYAVSPEEAAKREDPEAREKHYETMLLDLIDERNYPTGRCEMTSPDTLDLALQVGLFQAPHLTVIDRRYEMVGRCKTQVVDGTCRIREFDGKPVKDELERVDRVREKYPWYFYPDVSCADEASTITEVEEHIDDVQVEAFRRKVGIRNVEGINVLAVDFGSTFTKVVTFNTAEERVQLRYVPTTVEDIRIGLANGLGVWEEVQRSGDWRPLQERMAEFDLRLPCSSAKGGLKVVTVAVTEAESGFAAETAALTAGAKLVGRYYGKLTHELGRKIYEQDQPEIILLAGGTDEGGEAKVPLHNARVLAETAKYVTHTKYGVPVVYAGNQDIADDVVRIFKRHGVDVRVVENVMPEVNHYVIETVNEAIRELFQTVIIRGKGFDVVEEYMDAPFIPTPRAAFLGVNLLARGYGKEEGIGPIVCLDVGGATTDFYANVPDNPLYVYPWDVAEKRRKRTILKTPNMPLAYRRVEGKYGMAYNAENLVEIDRYQTGEMQRDLNEQFSQRFSAVGLPDGDPFAQFLRRKGRGYEIDLGSYLKWIHHNPHTLPRSREESWVRAFLTQEVMRVATKNNVGYVRETDVYFLQYGVNFFNQPVNLLLVGGPIYGKARQGTEEELEELRLIARGALFNPEEYTILRPNGSVYLDAHYMLSTVGGLYGRVDPERAVRMLKRHLMPLEVERVEVKLPV